MGDQKMYNTGLNKKKFQDTLNIFVEESLLFS